LQFLMMLTAVMAFAACGGGGPSGTSRPAGGSAPAASAAAVACTGSGGEAVAIQNNTYVPTPASVGVGSTVTWTNNDSISHTVTFDTGPDCGNLAGGATKSAMFAQAGTYPYHCTIHPNMKGTVEVQ
jgi:plastocyanin